MANLCNVDGRIVPEADARIPVLDRGFLFGDSCYEVVKTAGEVPFAWPEHFARLRASAASVLLELDLDEATVARRVAATLAAAAHGDSYVRLIVTRGTGEAPNIDLAYAPGPPRWVLIVRPLPAMTGRPARLWLVDRLRNDRRALDPATKSGNYLNNVLGLAEAKARGATDCVMLNHAGFVTEASTANVFARVRGEWVTPPLASGILAGVTRALLLDFLPRCGERVAERDLDAVALHAADELFLSSSLRDISPVTHLDGRALHDGSIGPHCARLMQRFLEHTAHLQSSVYRPAWARLLASAAC
ncbi:MAG TPA: aminotransferase class IV [Planctomycetota bacterium]|nr:aminotransferase class IV [Planctomycetota bacterium]